MNKKIILGTILGILNTIPFVAADVKVGPMWVRDLVLVAIVIGLIVGAVYLIKWIAKKVKKKK